ncbi:MAG: Crp/Fnr family transcriptional regulator [Patescibacteria group bacterium]|nr:Crp/Fnr family transcriptional regulator [Patescibacteria group bacterium]
MTSHIANKIEQHFSQFPKRTYPAGQILVFADENPEHIFYIVKGRVRKYDVSYRGEEVILNIFRAPSYFPMSWAINRLPNEYFYKTETSTVLHVVPTDEALQFVKDNPDVMLDLLSRIYKGMDGLLGRVVGLMSGSAQSRLVYELIVDCRRFGQLNTDGSYTLSTTEVDLAARSGLSRETISREIHKLKTDGLVSVSSTGIVINDFTGLKKRGGTKV